MFPFAKNWLLSKALNGLKEKFVNPNLEGIATVREIAYRDKMLFLTLILEGLEDKPIEVWGSGVEIAADGSSIKISKYESNMPFAKTALNRFATMPIPVPEGAARLATIAAKKALGL